MEFSYKVLKAHKNGLDVSKSKHGLNVSCALDMGSGKIIISLIGKFKKSCWTNMGGGLFSQYL